MSNPLALLDWSILDAAHCYSRRDTALYALSVGMGSDPLDRGQLDFIDPWNDGLTALPSMALVLGYPGFWLGDPKVARVTGLRPEQILHVEQSVHLRTPLPPAGCVVGRTRVTGMVDKGAERGSLLYSEREITYAGDTEPLAVCRQVHYLRGLSGFGGISAPQHRPRVMPTSECNNSIDFQTRPDQALLYRLNGDANPLHIDPLAAKRAGFDRPILHGMCTAAVVLRGVIKLLADDNVSKLRSFTLRMSAPVLPGEIIRTEVWNDGSFRASRTQDGKVVIDNGYAKFAP